MEYEPAEESHNLQEIIRGIKRCEGRLEKYKQLGSEDIEKLANCYSNIGTIVNHKVHKLKILKLIFTLYTGYSV